MKKKLAIILALCMCIACVLPASAALDPVGEEGHIHEEAAAHKHVYVYNLRGFTYDSSSYCCIEDCTCATCGAFISSTRLPHYYNSPTSPCEICGITR